MFVIKYRKIFFGISLVAAALSLGAIGFLGLNLGIDFTGGSIVELNYGADRPEIAELRQALEESDFSEATIQPAGEESIIFRLGALDEGQKEAFIDIVSIGNQEVREDRFSAIGPTLSSELSFRGVIAVILVVLLIVFFIAFVFRGVSRPVSSWVYGGIAIVALLHDVIIPAGIFAVLGHLYGIEIDTLFLTAVLTILGLSVNDTIVVFDRIRENLQKKVSKDFSETVGISLQQTFARSINTSLTVIIVLLALYFLGGTTTREFALVLLIGAFVGTYSSIFLASPLLVAWEKWQKKSNQ